jgi:hypothetical protein
MRDPLVVPAGEGGLITSDGMTRLQLLIPSEIADGPSDQAIPPMLLYLMACIFRGESDGEFFQDQIEWMERQSRS